MIGRSFLTRQFRYDPSVTIKNEISCNPVLVNDAFASVASQSASVGMTNSSGWNVSGVASWAIPLTEQFQLGVTWSTSSATSWSHDKAQQLSTSVPWSYSLDGCHEREVWLFVTEKTRVRGSDRFSSVVYATGPMIWNGTATTPREQLIGYKLNRINGTSSWFSNLTTDAGPSRFIVDCDLNCGGISDGDIDNDGIPDENDDDMDGDGITNDHDDDIDGDGIPNYADPDDDNDGILDEDDDFNGPPGSDDIDGDGIPNEDDFDIDGDNIPNEFESGDDDDLDGDGIPNKDDADIDGDGIPNEQDDTPYGRIPTLLVWIDGEWRRVPLLRR